MIIHRRFCDICTKELNSFRDEAETVTLITFSIGEFRMSASMPEHRNYCIPCAEKALKKIFVGEALERMLEAINDHRMPLK
jgi:DNA-binding transcriptional regulator LsrR (DeoR family)